MRTMRESAFFAFLVFVAVPSPGITASPLPAAVTHVGNNYTLTNGFVAVTFTAGGLLYPGAAISSLRGDFAGQGNYGEELLDGNGYTLEVIGTDGTVFAATEAETVGITVDIVGRGPATAAILVKGICAGGAIESWSLMLAAGSRSLELNTTGMMSANAAGIGATVSSVRHKLVARPLSLFGFYPDDGVVQMMNAQDNHTHMASTRKLKRIYMIGGVNPINSNSNSTPPSGSHGGIDIVRPKASAGQTTVLFSDAEGGRSGFMEVVAGTITANLDAWGNMSSEGASKVTALVSVGSTWSSSMSIAANNHNFPNSGLVVGPNLPTDDLAALMTGVYGSAPGCLCTFPNSPACPGMEGKHQKVGQIATTVARPDRGYAGTYNYFDPDYFFSMSALIYSGEPFLQEQARTVIERSGEFLCVGEVEKKYNCTYGQLPHHFVNVAPTFLALSGATQTGPNTFWVKSALQYARNSANMKWLRSFMPTLRAAAAFCFDLINSENHLLLAPGSLMIDVFIRGNYTSDSNSMMVGFLNEFADAEAAVGNTTGSAALRYKALKMAEAINEYLWDTDHFVTQVDPSRMNCVATHSCRDFVDYDSNLIALAHAIPTMEKAKQALHRIDTGIQKCSAMQGGGPQWTSEIWYGKNDTLNGNVGDSSSAMGRIAWFDAKARKLLNDVNAFDHQLGVMQKDLLAYTWMHERYGCDGKMQTNRTAAYFEYPSTVAMLLREVRYGIELNFARVTVKPMLTTPGPFSYHVGNVNVDYNPEGESKIEVPSAPGLREYRLHGMWSRGSYVVSASGDCKVRVDEAAFSQMGSATASTTVDGILAFWADGSCGVVSARVLDIIVA